MQKNHERYLHRTASFIGGFAAMYTVMIRMNLGSSQTVNLLDLTHALLGRDIRQLLLRIIGVIIYGSSVFSATYLTKKGKVNTRLISAVLSITAFIIAGFLPAETDHCIALYPFFLSMSFMCVVYGNACEYASAPIFSTNNFRQTIGGIAEYLADHDKKALDKSKFYAGTLAVFTTGSIISYFTCIEFMEKAIFFGVIPCIALLAYELVPSVVSAKSKS